MTLIVDVTHPHQQLLSTSKRTVNLLYLLQDVFCLHLSLEQLVHVAEVEQVERVSLDLHVLVKHFFEPLERSFGTVVEPVFNASDTFELKDIKELFSPDEILEGLDCFFSQSF